MCAVHSCVEEGNKRIGGHISRIFTGMTHLMDYVLHTRYLAPYKPVSFFRTYQVPNYVWTLVAPSVLACAPVVLPLKTGTPCVVFLLFVHIFIIHTPAYFFLFESGQVLYRSLATDLEQMYRYSTSRTLPRPSHMRTNRNSALQCVLH